MEHLFEKLKLYSETDVYPYHMPGHKRRPWGELPKALYDIDITEIDNFDNLHQPEELLKALQEETARLYGAEESFYMVNGSTGGILAAISAAVPMGGRILMARNCHKSAYHASYLCDLTISYLYPEIISKYDICDAIEPNQVKAALEKEPDIAAVLIVSPTYEGRIADVSAIAEIVHAKGIPLIVDEAHGAHLGLAEGFAKNSCRCGADLVIHSVHKTLPAMTQAALLHVNGTLINREKLRRFLRIFQSSSPSYVLMASIDNALQYVQRQGREAFATFLEYYTEMCQKLSVCKQLSFLKDDWNCQDVGKLVISVKDTTISGKELYNILLEEYHLQLEMAAENYVLAMFTLNDGQEAYARMVTALLEIDARLETNSKSCNCINDYEKVKFRTDMISAVGSANNVKEVYPKKVLSLRDAWDADSEWVALENALDKPAAEFVNLYPPGIPLLVPGEYITEDMVQRIRNAVCQNLNVQGVQILQALPGHRDKTEIFSQIKMKVIK